MKKITKSRVLVTSSILTLGTVAISAIVGLQKHEERQRLLFSESLINERAILNQVPVGQEINNDSSINIPEGQSNVGKPNSICSFGKGIFYPTDAGCFALDPATLEVKWRLTNNDNSVNNVIGTRGNRVFHTYYNKEMNVLLVLHQQNANLVIEIVNPSNGRIIDSSGEFEWIKQNSDDQNSVIIPISGASNSFYVVPRGAISHSQRKIFQFWIDSQSKRFTREGGAVQKSEAILGNGNNTTSPIILNVGAYWRNGYNNLIAVTELMENGDIVFRTYKGGNELLSKVIRTGAVYNKDDPKLVPNYVYNMQIGSWGGNNVTFNGLINDNHGRNSIAFSLTIPANDGSDNQLTDKYIVDLDASKIHIDSDHYHSPDQDYDIEYGYYSELLEKFVVYNSYTLDWQRGKSFGLFDLNYLSQGQSFAPNSEYVPGSKRVQLFYPGANDAVSASDNSAVWVPTFANNNLFVFKTHGNYVVYNKDSQDPNAPYAYNTNWMNDISLDGLSNKKLNESDVNNQFINEQLNNYNKAYSFTLYSNNSQLTISNMTNTNENIYKGEVSFDALNMSNGYNQGRKEDVSFTGDNKRVIKGFHIWNTTKKLQDSSSIQATPELNILLDDPNHVNNVVFKDFLFEKMGEIFNDQPIDITAENLIVEVVTSDQTTMEFNVKLNKWVENGVLKSTEKDFDNVVVSGLNNKTTAKKAESISITADDTLNTYTPWILKGELQKASSNIKTKVINFVLSKKAEIYDYVPNDIQIEIQGVEEPLTNNTIKLKLVKSNYWKNGIKTNQPDSVVDVITLESLATQHSTEAISNVEIDANQPSVSASEWASNVNSAYALTIIDQLFNHLPDKYDDTNQLVSDILEANIEVSAVTPDNSTGKITFTLKLNKFFNQSGVCEPLQDFTNALPTTVTLTGFNKVVATELSNTTVTIDSLNNTYVSDLYDGADTTAIKNLIVANKAEIFNTIGEQFAASDISDLVVKGDINNVLGQIEISFKLNNNYYDANGLVTNGALKEFPSLTIKGFKKLNEAQGTTTLPGGALSGVNTILPTEWQANEDAIKTAIIPLITNVVPNKTIVAADITLALANGFTPSNKTDELRLNVTINNSKVMVNGVVKTTHTFENISFTGFKTQQPTAIKNQRVTVEGVAEQTAVAWLAANEDTLDQFIFNKKDEIFSNLPEGFTKENIQFISKTASNNDGQITIELYLTSYIDDAGNLVSNGDQNGFKQTITLIGFIAQGATALRGPEVTISSLSGKYVSDFYDGVNKDVFKQLIVDNKAEIFNTIGNLAVGDIVSITVNDSEVNNVSGQISISFELANNYYNDQGQIVTGTNKRFSPLVIKGFNKLDEAQGTTTLPGGALSGVNTILPTEWQANEDAIETAIIPLITNVVPNKDIEAADITLALANEFSPSNKTDELRLNVTINNSKVMVDGIVKTTHTFENISFTGFKTQQPTAIKNQQVTVEGVAEQTAVAWLAANEATLDQFIFNKKDEIFSNLPEGFTKENIKFVSKNASNNVGQITIELYLTSYIDDAGNLVSNGDQNGFKQTITLIGFRAQGATALRGPEVTISSLSEKYVSDFYDGVNKDVFKQLIVDNKASIFNTIGNLVVGDIVSITVNDSEVNNVSGQISISFELANNYYNDQGQIVTGTNKTFGPLVIKGFRKLDAAEGTTTLAETTPLDGVNTILPIEWRQNEQAIKEAIAAKIKNPAHGQTITAADINLTIIGNPSNKEGNLVFNVEIINSKGQVNGVVEAKVTLISRKFTGFKTQQPTTPIEQPDISAQELENILGGKENMNKLPSEILEDSALKTKFEGYVKANLGKFISNLPTDATVSNVKLEANNAEGSIKVTITLDKYFNQETGQLVNSSYDFVSTVKKFNKDNSSSGFVWKWPYTVLIVVGLILLIAIAALIIIISKY